MVFYFQTNTFSDPLYDSFSNFERYEAIYYSYTKYIFIYNNEYNGRRNKTQDNNKNKDSKLLKKLMHIREHKPVRPVDKK